MAKVKTKVVRARWDSEAKVWCAASDDIPGLVAEEETYEELLETVLELAPELLRLNGVINAEGSTITLIAERTQAINAAA